MKPLQISAANLMHSVRERGKLFLAALACWLACASTAHAALDAEAKKPYQIQVVVHVGANRVFTPLFQDQLERDLANQLKLVFGELAKIEIARTHPLLADIEKKGLDATLEGYDAISDRTTHFVLVDLVAGAYQIQTRFHEGLTGQPGAAAARVTTHDRADVARTVAQLVESSFSPVGVVAAEGKNVTLRLKGGDLGVPLDRWVKKGHAFAVSQIVQESNRVKGVRLEWALLEVLDPPAAGVCRCRYWRRYQEDDLRESSGTLGYRAQRLATTPGPVRVRLLDDATLAPLDGAKVRVQQPGAGKALDLLTNRDGLATTDKSFGHFALVQVLDGDNPRAQFPVPLVPGRTTTARIKIKTDGESLAPFATRRDAWLRRIYENARVSSERSRELSRQLHQSLDAALAAGKKSLPALQEEITYLDSERDQLNRLAKDKKWPFDPREGDREMGELRKQEKELREFVKRIEAVLKDAGSETSLGLVQLLERAKLFEAEAEFDQAIRLYEQVMQASPGEKKVQEHLAKLKAAWAPRGDKHAEARTFLLQTWPTLDVVSLEKNMAQAKESLDVCKNAGDRLTPLRLLRANAVHTANLKKQLDTLQRRDSEDNRNQAKTLARTGEALLQLHQAAAAWVGAK